VLFWSGVAVRGARVSGIWRLVGRAVGLGVALQSVLLLAAGAAAAGGSSAPMYDLSVIVLARSAAPTQVALSYSRVIDEGRLRAGIGELGERSGAQIGGVQIRDTALARGSTQVATGAQFAAPGLINWETGVLPVGAIIRSLPGWEHMRMIFIVDEGFPFSGPTQVTADGFAVRLVNRMEAYEYDVERMTGRIGPPGEGVPLGEKSAALLPAVLIGVPPGLVLGWLLSDRRRGGRGA